MRIAFISTFLGMALFTAQLAGQTGRPPKGKPPAKDTPTQGTEEDSGDTYAGKTLNQWRKELKVTGDPSKRTQAIVAIMSFPAEKGEAAVLDLVDRLSDGDTGVRVKACLALRYVHVENSDHVQRVVKALASRVDPLLGLELQSIVRYEAAATLLRFAPSAGPEIPKIINGLMRDRSAWENRRLCASILWHIPKDAKAGPDPRIVSAFVDSFMIYKEPCYLVKLELMKGLGAIGKPANKLLQGRVNECLQKAAVSNNMSLALWACVALLVHADGNDVETKFYLKKVAQFLNDKDTDVKVQAAMALSGMAEKAKARVPDILAMLNRDKNKDTASVFAACAALGRMGDRSDKVVDALLDLLENKEPARAAAGIKAIVDLKLRDARVMEALKKTQADVRISGGLKTWVDAAIKELSAPQAAAKN